MNRSRIGRQLSTLPMWETPIVKIHIQSDPHYFQTILHIFNYQLQFSWMVMTPICALWKGWAPGLKPGGHCLIHISTVMWIFGLFGVWFKKQPPELCTSLENLIKKFTQNTRTDKNSLKRDFNEVERLYIYIKIKLHGRFLCHMDISWPFRFILELTLKTKIIAFSMKMFLLVFEISLLNILNILSNLNCCLWRTYFSGFWFWFLHFTAASQEDENLVSTPLK